MAKKTKQKFTTYSNLAREHGRSKRAIKREVKAREHAEYLATLPKNPFLRFFARLHPKRVFKYWFSMRGLKMIGKIIGVTVLIMVIFVGALYFYFRKELEGLSLDELLRRAETDTVSIYYDRNGEELWRDAGTGDYRLVVKSEQIHDYLKQATVSVEDKDFYEHSGVSYSGMVRAVINNVTRSGGNTQGGSTLTQQLIKQVYFADEAAERGIAGIPRKIKEAILSIEAENMYDKDQILTAYLNVSPYGGRRNGVESAAQTYFGHSAKNLGCEIEKIKDENGRDIENCLSYDKNIALAEAALLASIPQSPTLYNPYNIDGNEALITRQHLVLNDMVKMNNITREDADMAKEIPILERLRPLSQQMSDAKAPYFVQMVKSNLIEKLGATTVGQGGLRITTTLDLRVQEIIDVQVDRLFQSKTPDQYGFDSASVVMIDNKTGQILGLRGGRDYNYPDYGAVNMATSFIQPGSTIKPQVFAALIDNKENPNGTFGAGSIVADTPIPQSIYQTDGRNSVRNADGQFKGDISIRQSLGESRNVPAIRAMSINSVDATKDSIQDMGNLSYCTDGVDKMAGLAAAIGSCGVKQTEHTNAFATIANMGRYNPVSDILKVVNSNDDILYEWEDESKQAIDPQTAYIISDILGDSSAKHGTFGSLLDSSHNMNGVRSALKTGTSDIGGLKKDLWFVSYTPKATVSMWWGNHVPKALRGGSSYNLAPMINEINKQVYNNVFKVDGIWKPGDWFALPQGIQRLDINGKIDLYPSWFNKNQKINQMVRMTFDKVSKKLATDCTPLSAREELDVIKNTDPLTKQISYTAPEGYDAQSNDDFHSCNDVKPFISEISPNAILLGGGKYTIWVSVRQGTHAVSNVTINLNGNSYNAVYNGGRWEIIVADLTGSISVSAIVIDAGLYTSELSRTVTFGDGLDTEPTGPGSEGGP